LNGEELTLRPENTAGVVRASIEHSMLYEGGKRLYYMGPMFRHERPQRGRYRQFHQIGAEALGFAGPEVDAEIILLAHHLWKSLGLVDVRLELNSLGQLPERIHPEAGGVLGFGPAKLSEEEQRQGFCWFRKVDSATGKRPICPFHSQSASCAEKDEVSEELQKIYESCGARHNHVARDA
jgi:hypothetical protein